MNPTSPDRAPAPTRHPLEPAYRRTPYRVAAPDGPITFRIGRRDTRIDALLRRLGARDAVLLTAWNPCSRRRSPGWNRRAQERLRLATHRLPSLPAESLAGRWSEPQRFLAVDPRRGKVLARRFGQNALVLLRRGRPPRLGWC